MSKKKIPKRLFTTCLTTYNALHHILHFELKNYGKNWEVQTLFNLYLSPSYSNLLDYKYPSEMTGIHFGKV